MHDRPPDLPALTGLRFVAAFLILLNHLLLNAVPRTQETFAPILSLVGILGMSLFFVLSGFIIHYTYGATLLRPGGTSFRRFIVARIARLYPLYLFFLGLTIVSTADLAALGWRTLLASMPATLLMAQSWVYVRFPTVILPHLYNSFSLAWSISTEMLMYLMYPAVLLLVRRDRLGLLASFLICGTIVVLLSGGLAAAWRHIVVLDELLAPFRHPGNGFEVAGENSFMKWLLFTSPYGRFPEFVIGVLTAHVYMRLRPVPIGRLEAMLGLAATVISLAVILASLLPVDQRLWIVSVILSRIGYGAFIAAIIFCCARYRHALMARTLSLRPLVMLGTWSYGIYLAQSYVARLFPGLTQVDAWKPVSVLAFWATLFAVSAVLYRYVEMPGRAFILRSAFIARLVGLPAPSPAFVGGQAVANDLAPPAAVPAAAALPAAQGEPALSDSSRAMVSR